MGNAGLGITVVFFWALATFLFITGEYGYWFIVGIIGLVSSFIYAGQSSLKKEEKKYILSSLPQYSSSASPVSEYDLQNNFTNFSWREMEELTGKLFEKKGYSVEVTKSTGDFGLMFMPKKQCDSNYRKYDRNYKF